MMIERASVFTGAVFLCGGLVAGCEGGEESSSPVPPPIATSSERALPGARPSAQELGDSALRSGGKAIVCEGNVLKLTQGEKVSIIPNPIVDIGRRALQRDVVGAKGAIFGDALSGTHQWFDAQGNPLKSEPACALRPVFTAPWQQPNGRTTYELVLEQPDRPIVAPLDAPCALARKGVHVVIDTNDITADGILNSLKQKVASQRCGSPS